jgi:hypothetical protein
MVKRKKKLSLLASAASNNPVIVPASQHPMVKMGVPPPTGNPASASQVKVYMDTSNNGIQGLNPIDYNMVSFLYSQIRKT